MRAKVGTWEKGNLRRLAELQWKDLVRGAPKNLRSALKNNPLPAIEKIAKRMGAVFCGGEPSWNRDFCTLVFLSKMRLSERQYGFGIPVSYRELADIPKLRRGLEREIPEFRIEFLEKQIGRRAGA